MNPRIHRTGAAVSYTNQHASVAFELTSNDENLISAHTDSSMVESTSDVCCMSSTRRCNFKLTTRFERLCPCARGQVEIPAVSQCVAQGSIPSAK